MTVQIYVPTLPTCHRVRLFSLCPPIVSAQWPVTRGEGGFGEEKKSPCQQLASDQRCQLWASLRPCLCFLLSLFLQRTV